MASVELNLALSGLTDATKQLTQFGKTADSALSAVSSGFAQLKAAAAVVGVSLALGEIVKSAEEADQAVLSLNTAMKLSGDFTKAASKDFQDLASSIQKTANISDETIIGLESQAKAIGLTNSQTASLTKASVDLAAVMGTDVNTAFTDLEKTLNGTVSKGLKNRFPELKQLSIEALASGEAISTLGSRFAGAAAELNNTFAGQSKGVGVALGEVFESIGKIITQNPVFVEALRRVKDALFTLADFIGNNIAPAIETINSAFASLAQGAGAVISFFAPVIASFIELTVPIKALVQGIGIALPDALSSLSGSVTPVFRAFLDLGTFLRDSFVQVVKFLTVGVLGLIQSFERLKGNTDAVTELQNKIDALVASSFEQTAAIDANTAAVKENIDAGVQYVVQLSEQEKAQSSLTNATKKASEERQKAIQEEIDKQKLAIAQAQRTLNQAAAQNPLQFLGSQGAEARQKFTQTEGLTDAQKARGLQQANAANAVGLGAQVFKGSGGAADLITGALGQFADTILPGIGGIVTQVAGVLAQGPEAAAGFVKGFIDAIPTIIENIIASIPAVINALIQSIPQLISRLVQEIPGIAIKFALSLANQAPFIATRFAIEFIKQIPEMVKGLVNGIVDAIKQAIGSIGNIFGGGGGGGGILSDIGGFLGFADGGVVPGGAPFTDRVPIMATPGEPILSLDTTARLNQFLDKQQLGSGSGGVQQIAVALQLDGATLASTIVDLRRKGFQV